MFGPLFNCFQCLRTPPEFVFPFEKVAEVLKTLIFSKIFFEERLICLKISRNLRGLVLKGGLFGKEITNLNLITWKKGQGPIIVRVDRGDSLDPIYIATNQQGILVNIGSGPRSRSEQFPNRLIRAVLFTITRVRFVQYMSLSLTILETDLRWIREKCGDLFPNLRCLRKFELHWILYGIIADLSDHLGGFTGLSVIDEALFEIIKISDLELTLNWLGGRLINTCSNRFIEFGFAEFPENCDRWTFFYDQLSEIIGLGELLANADYIHFHLGPALNKKDFMSVIEMKFEQMLEILSLEAEFMRSITRMRRNEYEDENCHLLKPRSDNEYECQNTLHEDDIGWEIYLSKSLPPSITPKRLLFWGIELRRLRNHFQFYLAIY